MYKIRFEEYSPDGTRHVLGGPINSEAIIGRSPRSGITVSRQSVSREHGKFYPVGDCWCYTDIGSTNGSWYDGKVVKKGESVLVRPGDRVQLADTFVMIAKGERNYELSPTSVVVVTDGEGVGEFDLSQGGVFVFGGPQSATRLVGPMAESPIIELVTEGEFVKLFLLDGAHSLQGNDAVTLNGRVAEDGRLNDRDRLVVGNYEIIINAPTRSSRSRGATIDTSMALGVPSEQGGDIAAAKAVTAQISGKVATAIRAEQTVSVRTRSMSPLSTFGQMPEASPDVGEEKMEALLGYGGSSIGQRGSYTQAKSEVSTKDKFYVLVGIVVLVGIILLGAFYILSRLGLV